MWNVPVNHKQFNEINTAQWMWYYHNFFEDEEEKYNRQRDFIEYHASFIEPEAVRKIREAREESVDVPHDEFVAGIEYFFGRQINLPKEKRKGSETHNIDPKSAIKRSDNYKMNKPKPGRLKSFVDYEFWLNLNLE